MSDSLSVPLIRLPSFTLQRRPRPLPYDQGEWFLDDIIDHHKVFCVNAMHQSSVEIPEHRFCLYTLTPTAAPGPRLPDSPQYSEIEWDLTGTDDQIDTIHHAGRNILSRKRLEATGYTIGSHTEVVDSQSFDVLAIRNVQGFIMAVCDESDRPYPERYKIRMASGRNTFSWKENTPIPRRQ